MTSMVAGISFAATAQVTVVESGQTVFGAYDSKSTSSLQSTPDSESVAFFCNPKGQKLATHITFGPPNRINVGEVPDASGGLTGHLQLKGQYGIVGNVGSNRIFEFISRLGSTIYISPAFRFYSDVKANSFVVVSDGRFKEDVKTLEGSAEGLSLLSPVRYSLTAQNAEAVDTPRTFSTDSTDEADEVVEESPLAPDPRTRFGFIAQEVQEIFPELVIEDADGTLGIDYTGFIPLLVDALGTLQRRVEEQQEIIDALSSSGQGRQLAPSAGVRDLLIEAGAEVAQNTPNPFSASTRIACNVPISVSEAVLFVYDLQGQQRLHIPVTERGGSEIVIEGSTLTPGMYIYTLIADGVEIGSKRMILTD